LKQYTNEQHEILFRKNEELQTYLKGVEATNTTFRETLTVMENDSIHDLIPNLTAEDVAPDLPTNPIESDPKVNPKAGEGRMFTIQQI